MTGGLWTRGHVWVSQQWRRGVESLGAANVAAWVYSFFREQTAAVQTHLGLPGNTPV